MAKDILEDIVAWKRHEVELFKGQLPPRELHRRVEQMAGTPVPSMRKALREAGTGIIAEFKRKSPSKGWIKEEGRADTIPLAYQHSGAAVLSILTDERYFGGSDAFVAEARSAGVTLPILYKNFVIDEYQLFQARLCGASAVLLIAAILTKAEYGQLAGMAHELGMEVLLETHSEREIEYADTRPDLCGVNNRNLGTFVTDVNNSFLLAGRLPNDCMRVSESGISNPAVIKRLKAAGYEGFLIGEQLMKAARPGDALKELLDSCNQPEQQAGTHA